MTEKAAQSKADYTIICLRLRVAFMWSHAITTIFICNKLTVRSLLNHWISRVFRTKGFPFSNAQILQRHLLSIFRTYKAENILTMLSGLHRLKKPANSRCSARNLVLPSFGGAGGGSAISLSPPLGRGRGWVSDELGVGSHYCCIVLRNASFFSFSAI